MQRVVEYFKCVQPLQRGYGRAIAVLPGDVVRSAVTC